MQQYGLVISGKVGRIHSWNSKKGKKYYTIPVWAGDDTIIKVVSRKNSLKCGDDYRAFVRPTAYVARNGEVVMNFFELERLSSEETAKE